MGCGISGTMTATCQEKPEDTTAKPGDVFTDVLVAVHGIGEQARFATVRSVTERIARSDLFQSNGKGTPIPIQPLGYFHGEMKKLTSLIQLDDADTLKDSDLARIGFAEVYWADIPDEVLKEGKTMEETKAWARTVVARADALCTKSAQEDPEESIVPPDFDHAGDVLDEIIDTVRVLENLFFLAEKAGLFKFDLRQILMEYLGDVQLVTEFAYHRKNIVGRFHHAMQQIYEQCQKTCPKVRIHIVAHSEGKLSSKATRSRGSKYQETSSSRALSRKSGSPSKSKNSPFNSQTKHDSGGCADALAHEFLKLRRAGHGSPCLNVTQKKPILQFTTLPTISLDALPRSSAKPSLVPSANACLAPSFAACPR